jgi:putative phage-type endonuclease
MTKQELIGTKTQRQARIGGSEFATVMDINPYKKRIELVLEKAGVIANTFEGNEATRRGEFLENDIIAKFEDATGLTVSNEQQEFIIEPNDCLPLVCHVDGITSDDAVFEAKTTDIKSKTWQNGISEYYKAQLEFNCKLANKQKAYIAVGYCDGNEIVKFEYYKYKPEKPMSEIVGECQKFTNDVEIYKSYGVVNNGLILKSKIDNNLIEELESINETISNLKQKIKPYEEQKKLIEAKLKEQIGDNWGIENDLYKITMSNRITAPSYEYKISRSGLKIERKEV